MMSKHHRFRRFLSCLLFGTICASLAFAVPPHPPNVADVLDACRGHQAYVTPLSMDVRVRMHGEGKLTGADGNVDTYDLRVQRTLTVIDAEGSNVVVDAKGKEYPEMRYEIRERAVGKDHMKRKERRGDGDPEVVIDPAPSDAVVRLLFDSRFGWMLEGYFFGMNQQSVVQLLANAEETESTLVEDSSLLHIKAKTAKHGTVEAWFDADHDFLLRKYRLSKSAEDRFDDTPLQELPRPEGVPPTITWVVETSEFDVKVIDGIALPVSGTLTLTVEHPGGSSNVIRYEISRENIEFSVDPELEKLSSFIPEGANVLNREHPGLRYTLQGGEFVPPINRAAIARIDALIESFANRPLNDSRGGDSDIGVEDSASCGLYCVYTAARSFGLRPDVHALFQPEHISAAEGSSLSELLLASETVGLKGRAIGGLSPGDLRTMQMPVILHVRDNSRAIEPNHFVLLLQVDGCDAILFYPPSSTVGPRIKTTPLPVLPAHWGRSAMLLTADEQPAAGLLSSQRRTLVMAAGVVVWFNTLLESSALPRHVKSNSTNRNRVTTCVQSRCDVGGT